VDNPAAAFGRYRVSLDTTRVDDRDAAVMQLLSICHCRIEPYAEEGFTGFLISATPAAARMLSSDPRVSAVEELVSEAAAVIPSVERGTRAVGATESAPRNEPAATAVPHTPVSNAGITAWDTGTYTYDGSGNIRSIGTTQIYTYDLYGRLAYGKVQASRFQRFSYDRFGNLLNTTTNNDTPPAPQTISGVSNRLSSGGATYDAAGRMLTGTGVAFRYDGDGMPTWSQMAAGSVTQTKVQIYSATDERIASLWIGPANGSDWTIRDAGGQVLRRLHKSTSGQWSWQEDYVYRDGQMLASEVPTREKTLHYHLDHLGTPRLITGNGGAQVALHTYDPFGAEVTAANQIGTEPIKKFTGHERDTANIDYMHARYYQNGWGRFLSVDPVLDVKNAVRKPQSWNRYLYVLNNPVNAIDPNGRETYVITTFDYGVGTHSAMMVARSGDNVLYDPAGSYIPPSSEGGRRGSGDIFTGQDADLNAFVRYQESTGSQVKVLKFDTTPQQEAKIRERIEQRPTSTAPGYCALATCGVVTGIGPFKDVKPRWSPGRLYEGLKAILKKKDDVPAPKEKATEAPCTTKSIC
jgi:RHS repeat-associated protein